MERVGVRELRQHASRYLARVAAGESLEVTDRGRPVALLVPPPDDPWADLLARGLVQPAAEARDLLELPSYPGSLTSALQDLRADER